MSTDENKKELRRHFKKLRNALGEEVRAQADALINTHVVVLDAYKSADVLYAYLDFGSEVSTRDIIAQAWADQKTVALPWCVPGTRDMRWFEVADFSGLIKSPLGVEEPNPETCVELTMDSQCASLCLVPGLTFDAQGFRLGYGGGFYDNFLFGYEGVSVGLCREAQLSKSLRELGVIDGHDLSVQLVVTDGGIRVCGAAE